MTVTACITLTVLTQFAVFIGYPDTGPLGLAFVTVAAGAWSAYHVTIACAMVSARASTRTGLSVFGLMLSVLLTALFLPQRDGVAVLDKISLGQYPTRASAYVGLGKLGIDYPAWKPPETKMEPVQL